MIVTRAKLSEQIQIIYSQFIGKDKFDDNLDKRIIDANLDQAIAKFVKIQTFENFKAGNMEIPSVAMIDYTLTATASKITLPLFPINLPYDMGVWSVKLAGVGLIPVPNVQLSVISGTATEFLEGQLGYSVSANSLKLIGATTGIFDVTLLTTDFSLISDSELLPVSPELQLDIINEVLNVISNGAFSQKELNYNANKND